MSIPEGILTGDHSGEPIEYLVLRGFARVIATIKTANGYWTEVSDDNILSLHKDLRYDSIKECANEFPAVVINTGSTEYQDMPQYTRQGVMTFPIIGYVLDQLNVDRALMRLAGDVHRAIYVERNDGCPLITEIISAASGKVHEIKVERVVTDEQILFPYGQFVMTVTARFTFNPNLQKP